MKTITLAALSMAISTTALAETVDVNKSSLNWYGSKITGDSHSGTIKLKEAKQKKGQWTFIADLSTIDETNMKGEWKQKFLSHIKSKDFFDIKKFPVATLKVDKLDSGYLFGKLTIKGKSNDVTIPFTKKGNTYTGELGFDRTKYDMIYGSGNFFKNLGDKVISDTVKLQFNIVVK